MCTCTLEEDVMKKRALSKAVGHRLCFAAVLILMATSAALAPAADRVVIGEHIANIG
jgi:hypothetical protein